MIFSFSLRKAQRAAEQAEPLHAHEQRLAVILLTQSRAMLGLDEEAAETILRFVGRRGYREGDVVFRQNDPTEDAAAMQLILSGEVVIEQGQESNGTARILNRLGPGDFIGEMGVIDGAPRAATCRAATDLVVAELTREQLFALIAERPRVGSRLLMAIAQRMAERLRESSQKLYVYEKLFKAMQTIDTVRAAPPSSSGNSR
jgi:CRP-like cAMP-binding protein